MAGRLSDKDSTTTPRHSTLLFVYERALFSTNGVLLVARVRAVQGSGRDIQLPNTITASKSEKVSETFEFYKGEGGAKRGKERGIQGEREREGERQRERERER